jgi:hypothetical protein
MRPRPTRPYRAFLSVPILAHSDADAVRQADRYARSLHPPGSGQTEMIFEPGDGRGLWVRRVVHCDPGFRPPDPAGRDLMIPEAIE